MTVLQLLYTSGKIAISRAAKIGTGEDLELIPISIEATSKADWDWRTLLERVAAVILLLLALPLLGICAVALSVLSGRGPLIAHWRAGWRGTPLWMLKLRTMWDDETPRSRCFIERIADDGGPELKSESDRRVGCRFARFCRRHSIDELPQLWHVIRGEMSLVGPRPITERELQRYYGAHAAEILQVKPGLAGLWQVSGRNRLSYAERCRLDLRLVREGGLPLYFGILLRTLPEVLRGENSW